MTILQMQSTDSMRSQQITNGIFHRTRTKNFTIHMETQRLQMAKAVLRKKNGTEGINLSEFRLHYKATVIKTVFQKQKYRPMKQDRKPRNKLLPTGTLFLTNKIYNGAKIASSINGAGKTGQLHVKE